MILIRLPVLLVSLLAQSVVLALGQIWTNKVRAALTTIGIVIGIASVTAVIAALTGLKASVLSEFEAFGTNKIFVFPSRPPHGPGRLQSWSRVAFEADLFDGMLEHCPSVQYGTRMTFLTRSLSYGQRTEDAIGVACVDVDWHRVDNRIISQGRPFSLVDSEHALPVCLVNTRVLEKLLMPRESVGESILIGGRRFRVIGIVEPRSEASMFGGGGSGLEAFIPFETALRMRPGLSPFYMAASRSPEVNEEAQAELRFAVRRKRQIGPGQQDNFRVEAVQNFLESFRNVATAITLGASGVVGISLLVGGVGIMNIMLVSVSERTREIGLRKAVGARPGAILLQFLIEAIVLCMLGGALGLAAGQGLTSILASIPGAKLDKAYIPAWAVALSFGFAGTVGVVFGMFPAIKAARLDPIEALRHE